VHTAPLPAGTCGENKRSRQRAIVIVRCCVGLAPTTGCQVASPGYPPAWSSAKAKKLRSTEESFPRALAVMN
jgi:hypothetical protein